MSVVVGEQLGHMSDLERLEREAKEGKGREKKGLSEAHAQIQEVTYMGWLTFSKWILRKVTFRTYPPRPG